MEAAALSGPGFGPDAAPLLLDQALGEVETQAGTGPIAMHRQSPKGNEDPLQLVVRDPGAIVSENKRTLAIVGLRFDVDRAGLLVDELGRVREQIVKRLADPHMVP